MNDNIFSTKYLLCLLLSCVLIAAAGCNSGGGSLELAEDTANSAQTTSPADTTESNTETDATDAAETEIADFQVHEWGLVRFISTTADLSTSGHGYYIEDITSDKPLIYFHPGSDFNAATELSVQITVDGGQMREMWPAGGEVSLEGASYTWPVFKILPNTPCGVEDVPTLYPLDGDGISVPFSEFCAQFLDGGVCETAEMHAYLGEVPHCLAVNSLNAPVLLYNAYTNPDQSAPVAINDQTHSITNMSSDSVGPLWAAQINAAGGRLIYRIDVLAPGQTISLSEQPTIFEASGHDALLENIDAALQSAGLTDAEAEDFIEAWRPNVLAPARNPANATSPWAVLGFYAQETVERMYPLSIKPMPDDVVRVMAFTLEH